MTHTAPWIVLLVGALVGAIAGALAVRASVSPKMQAAQDEADALRARLGVAEATAAELRGRIAETKATAEQQRDAIASVVQSAMTQVSQQLTDVASKTFAVQSERTARIVGEQTTGVRTALETLQNALASTNDRQLKDRAEFAAVIQGMTKTQTDLAEAIATTQSEARRLATAMSTSSVRGTWGEIEFRRLLELAGMTEHVSFDTQTSGFGADGRGRPDVVIHLPGGIDVPCDSKVPFTAYQAACATDDEGARAEHLADAVAAFRLHITELVRRAYHRTPGSAGFTLMFVPVEAMLTTVLSLAPDLLEDAMAAGIMVASPLTLHLYLKAFSTGWMLHNQQMNAAAIQEEIGTLIDRLRPFAEHVLNVGRGLDRAHDAYNKAVGSFEVSVASSARRVAALAGTADEIPTLEPLTTTTRTLDVTRLPEPAKQTALALD